MPPPPAPRLLFDFAQRDDVAAFAPIGDPVMGGVSRGRLVATEHGTALFEGEVSLALGGGFASVRSRDEPRDLSAWQALRLELCGDGRRYKLGLRTEARFDATTWQASLQPPAGDWCTVVLPFASFRATRRGRPVPGAPPLDAGSIRSIGLLIGERQAGPFRLELRRVLAV